MATVAQKQSTVASLIDDIANTLSGLSAWSDADTTIVNDGASDSWDKNGRVFENTNMGVYLLMFVGDGNQHAADSDYDDVHGVRFILSNDWNSTDHHPAGKTTVTGNDPMSADIGNHRSDSFNNHRVSWSTSETGAWLFATDMGTAIDARSLSATYFISAGNDYLNVSAWNTSDGNNGMASAYGLEYVDSKFWNDGQDPWAFWQGDSYHDRMQTGYGWNSYISDSPSIEYLGTSIGNIESGDWGIINPDSTDDTFFFRRPTIYQTNSQTVPVAFLEDAIPNDKQEGAAHGDIVTYDATDYRIMQQSGAGKSNTISVGLRYE